MFATFLTFADTSIPILVVLFNADSLSTLSRRWERRAANFSLFAGSKHAIDGITKFATLERAAHGVRVNPVAPGLTETGMLVRLAPDQLRRMRLATRPLP